VVEVDPFLQMISPLVNHLASSSFTAINLTFIRPSSFAASDLMVALVRIMLHLACHPLGFTVESFAGPLD
tara:strand:+ start:959 stop:1168 length:210 start_codon:yes stop_codon:yes gene_type:complete